MQITVKDICLLLIVFLNIFHCHEHWYLKQILFSSRVVVQGPGPGPRYGHVMALVGQRYLMAIGGNDGRLFSILSHLWFVYLDLGEHSFGAWFSGKRPLADVWALDTAAKPYEWRKLEPEGEGPPPCM